MASKRKQKRGARRQSRASRSPAPAESSETRAAEVLTVGWMLATLATTLACALALLLLAAHGLRFGGAWPLIFSGLLAYLALASGIVTLALTAPVLRMRNEKPPKAITIYAVAVSLAPLVLLVVLSFLR